MDCSCCGEPYDSAELTALQCHAEVQLCRGCIGWLAQRSGMIDVTPTLPVLDMAESVAFYDGAGFEVRVYDGGFAFVSHDGQSVFDLGLEPVAAGAGAYLIVPDPDA